ncbi:MAG: tautomerase family protein [Pseudomonadota bacterium]
MPVIELHLIHGYDADAKARLGRALTAAVREVVPAAPEAITVMMTEHDAAGWMRGGERRVPAPALPDAEAVIRGYLSAMEARDLDTAQSFLAAGFEMHFPGAPPMQELEDLIEWAKLRYRFVRKMVAKTEVARADDATAVWVYGTLSGAWPDGTAFEGIRFVDRFALQGGVIIRQDVWNDIAEIRARHEAAS